VGTLISFDGRIRRKGYWLVGIALGIPNLMLYVLLIASVTNENAFGTIVAALLMIVVAIAGLSLAVRRWHDLDKSGWWVLIAAVPIIGPLYSLIMLGFHTGDQGPNSYGPEPEQGTLL